MDDFEDAMDENEEGVRDISFKVPCSKEQLDSLIDSALNSFDFNGKVETAFADINTTLSNEEENVEEINNLFKECASLVQQLQDEGKGDGSESDDDVQVVDVTYEPRAVKPTPQQLLMQALQKKGTIQPGQYYLQSNGDLKNLPPGQVAPPGTQVVTVKSNVPPQQQQIQPKQVQPRPIAPAPTIPQNIESLALGMKLYGKKNNEIWYKGTLVDIQNEDGPLSERLYKIKFDGKGMKVLNGKNIALGDPPTSTLYVGTRIIALYVDDEMEQRASFYAGIVAESPSVRNGNRYLVFFDDGYAQYSSFKDIRKVYEQNRRIWEEINPECSKFIKKYLDEYPERPMVRLQQGQVIKTEWNGRWWIARVQEVDASLVKMYFDADKRVEWIYRGSTRLEPLYTELANAEANKLRGRRHHLSQKSARKPVVEYTRQLQNEELMGGRIQQRTIQPVAVNHPAMKSSASDTINGKKKAVAKKSTSKGDGQANSGRGFVASSVSSNRTGLDMASILQNKLGQADTEELDEDALGEHVGIERALPETMRTCIKPHVCGPACLGDIDDDPIKLKGQNPLLIPILYGWERQIAKQRPSYKKFVFYRAPCARRLRNIKEVDEYLVVTNSQLTVDLFCFDPVLHTDSEFVPIKTFCDIKDLSYGKENVPISCVNGYDRQYPDYVDYSIVRTPGKGVDFKLDDDFMCGCDCTDNCRDSKKCACQQLTIQASAATALNVADPDTGYEHRRLPGYVVTGIYECNSKCHCDRRCKNRVAQNGLQLRLQVFKTEKRGWGMRCLDDIPAGGFICVYAGQMLSEQGANEDGQKYGDEYLAELDFIEVVERGKEGYESDVEDIEEEEEEERQAPDEEEEMEEEEEEDADSPDDELIPSESDRWGEKMDTNDGSTYSGEKRFLTRMKTTSRAGSKTIEKVVLKRQMSDENKDIWAVKVKDLSPQNKVQEWVKNLPTTAPAPAANNDAILIISSDEDSNQGYPGMANPTFPQVDGTYDDDDSNKKTTEDEASRTILSSTSTGSTSTSAATNAEKNPVVKVDPGKEASSSTKAAEPMAVDVADEESESRKEDAITIESEKGEVVTAESDKEDSLTSQDVMDNNEDEMMEDTSSEGKVEEGFGALQITEPTSLNVDNAREEDEEEDDDEEIPSNIFQRTTRSQTETHDGKLGMPQGSDPKQNDEKPQYPGLRDMFEDQDCYVMDAKSMGNLGRYLNHSCQPNVFVQNVFIDTHDLRFPWVAFFAAQYIRAGTELTWDYNYEIGSVPGKVLYCYCGAAECRGRLL